MAKSTPDFSIEVSEVKGHCPASAVTFFSEDKRPK
jgi:hypothetical protein